MLYILYGVTRCNGIRHVSCTFDNQKSVLRIRRVKICYFFTLKRRVQNLPDKNLFFDLRLFENVDKNTAVKFGVRGCGVRLEKRRVHLTGIYF